MQNNKKMIEAAKKKQFGDVLKLVDSNFYGDLAASINY